MAIHTQLKENHLHLVGEEGNFSGKTTALL